MPAFVFSRIASISALLVVAACGASQPAPSEPSSAARVTSASPARASAELAPRIVNDFGRPDGDVAPIVRAALAKKLDASPGGTLAIVPVLEPPTQIGADLSVSVKLEIRRANGELVASIRKTVAKPGAKPGDRAAEDELLGRATEEAAADFASHADAFAH
jgi:hypothetical protein